MATATKMVTCMDCMSAFPVTSDERELYALQGLRLPSRCPECRTSHERVAAVRAATPATPPRRRY